MICEKCGMQNVEHATNCANCGEPMPEMTRCAGFADILTFENADVATVSISNETERNGGYDETIMKSLLKKTDNVIAQNERNAKIGVIAAGISVVVLLCSVVFGIATMNAVDEAKADLSKVQTELRKTREYFGYVEKKEPARNVDKPKDTASEEKEKEENKPPEE